MDKEAAARLAEEAGIDPFLALLLTSRGVADLEAAEGFLLSHEPGDDPFGFADMDLAVERIQRAVDEGERIAVYGDYDADGITSTVLLYSYLLSKNANVIYHIPKREGDGYGLGNAALERLAADGVRLIVTVDNGISATAEIDHANSIGLEVVVTDHHIPKGELPKAVAVVDPHREDCGSEFKHYAGVGVAFKLVCALEGDTDWVLDEYADLIAVGTLADVMPLTSENRMLVREGLRHINENGRVGFKALLAASGNGDKALDSNGALFSLAPRINAAGRMGDPDKAARLLLCRDEVEAREMAEEVQNLNALRQEIEAQIFKEAQEQLEAHPEILHQRVLVLDGPAWHPGVVGIIASRIVDKYGKPCIVLTNAPGAAEEGDDGPGKRKVKGSGRSIRGFSLFDAIAFCGDILITYGGHELAAGVGLLAENIEAFRDRINQYAAEREMPAQELRIDCKLRPGTIDIHMVELIGALAPYGSGNPAPVFALCGMRLDNVTPVGNGRHLRLTLTRDGAAVTAMKFHTSAAELPVPCGSLVDAAVALERNEWGGTVSPSLIIRDIRYAGTDQEAVIAGSRLFDAVMRGELPEEIKATPPDRDMAGLLYKLLLSQKGWSGSAEQMHAALGGRVGYAQIHILLEVLRQAGLIGLTDDGNMVQVSIQAAEHKVDLNETELMKMVNGKLQMANG